MLAFVLAGGQGRRLAPISTPTRPKPFIRLVDGQSSLLGQTLSRLADLPPPLSVGIVGNCRHKRLLEEETAALRNGPDVRWLVLEPFSRNTGPAIVFSAMMIARHVPDMPLLFLPSDHVHLRWNAFRAGLAEALTHVRLHADICIFGLPPGDTGLDVGFICVQSDVPPDKPGRQEETTRCRQVVRFMEKPDSSRLARLRATGEVLVNAGMVLARACVIEKTAAEVAPALHAACARALETAHISADGRILLGDESWACCPDISFDIAVLEKARNVVCCRCDTGWHDVGTWARVRQALLDMARHDGFPPTPWRLAPHDVLLRGNVTTHDVHDALVWADENVRVRVEGVGDVAVIASGQEVLVRKLSTGQSMDVPKGEPVSAPWGRQALLFRNDVLGLQVKLLTVKPGARTSLQSHRHRDEWLLVLEGELGLRVGSQAHHLRRGDSRRIPRGSLHRLENRGDAPAILLEVQSGSYLGEDDITRFEDDYGRL